MKVDDGDNNVDDCDDNNDNDDAYDCHSDDKTTPSMAPLTNNIVFYKHSALTTVGNSMIIV